uniref:Ig-like domain-containing protein n=1 Tax=Anabas testudineus TaxID=64144 RepID=A0AAQ6IEX7_ANATE
VSMAAELVQDQLSLTKRAGETDTIRCSGTERCDKKHVYWYQRTDTDPFRVILRIDLSEGMVNTRYGHPQKDDFSASRKQNGCELVISKMKPIHSGSYYCVCWEKHSHSEK